MLIGAIVAGVMFGLYYTLVGLGLNLVFGVMRIVNLAHGDFLMLGGAATWWLFTTLGLHPLASAAIVVVFVLAGLPIYYLVVPRRLRARDSEMLSLILFFGLSQMIEAVTTIALGTTERSLPPRVLGVGPVITLGTRLPKAWIFSAAVSAVAVLLVMDEPSAGLSPLFVGQVIEVLSRFRALGLSMLIAEQNIAFLDLADRVLTLDGERIRFEGSVAQLEADDGLQGVFRLGLTPTQTGASGRGRVNDIEARLDPFHVAIHAIHTAGQRGAEAFHEAKPLLDFNDVVLDLADVARMARSRFRTMLSGSSGIHALKV